MLWLQTQYNLFIYYHKMCRLKNNKMDSPNPPTTQYEKIKYRSPTSIKAVPSFNKFFIVFQCLVHFHSWEHCHISSKSHNQGSYTKQNIIPSSYDFLRPIIKPSFSIHPFILKIQDNINYSFIIYIFIFL